jgi:hypothetical protein
LTAFGRFTQAELTLPGGRIQVALLPPWERDALGRIESVAQALLLAYGQLPRSHSQVVVVPLPGRTSAAPWGQVLRGGGATVLLLVGADAPADALLRDWTATHEFSHLLHPHLGARGRWLSEGLASYYQNVLRARAGILSPETAWANLAAGFERGRRDTNAKGLSLAQASRRIGTHRSYMRIYWSGAAYWLQADLALRERGTSLDQVLQRYAACCLERHTAATPERFLRDLERAAGAAILLEPYRRYASDTEFPETNSLLSDSRAAPARAAIMQRRAP